MPEAVGLMRDAFVALSSEAVTVPVRLGVAMPEYGARALFMPVYSPGNEQLAQKVVAIHPNNPDQGLPFIHALVLLFDACEGRPLAVMDGEFITALRTGAGSGLATDLLARQDARVLAVFGAGAQARTQVRAVCAVRQVEKVLIYGRSQENADQFAEEINAEYEGVDVDPSPVPAALRGADVICTATTSLTPVFSDEDVSLGCHINGVGSYRPDMTEIPAATVCRASVFVDQREAALEEAGDLIVPLHDGLLDESRIGAEIGEVALGTVPGRTSAQEVTFFKSVGNAVQDLVVASKAYEVAVEQGLGQEVPL